VNLYSVKGKVILSAMGGKGYTSRHTPVGNSAGQKEKGHWGEKREEILAEK